MNHLHESDEYVVTAINRQGVVVARIFKGLVGSEVIPLVNQLRENPAIVRVVIDIAFPYNDRDKTLITHIVKDIEE